MTRDSRTNINVAFAAPNNRLLLCLIALFLGSGGPIEAQVFKLCVHGNNNNVKAIPADQECSELSGPFTEFTVSDGDWLGQGTSVLHPESKSVNVAIGQEGATARLEVRGSLTASAGAFEIDSPFSNSPALASVTNGRAPAVSAVANGRGAALSGLVTGPNSAAPALRATHAGGRRAAEFEGEVRITRDENQLVLRDSNDDLKTWALTSHQATSGIGFWENGSTGRLVIAEGGNVGIGTIQPGTRLDINGNNAAGADLRVTDGAFARGEFIATGTGPSTPSTQDVELSIQARASSPTVRRAEIGTRSNHSLTLFTNLTNRLILGADGSVCLGAC
ncbi:MAG: hypothetical protein K9G71_05765 [Rhodobacteraceae bacterium]|nr:hypothetical protein [Paracoccaceae bacterium]MCF8513845.1 hypothetical protein [Paracoccaceae bacterium]MCF8518089.1 hypothetical protein [Paracoccaceae bacterium]